jgi:phosphomannomutase
MPETKLLVFDLDGTLAESKSEMSWEMAELLEQILEEYSVAVISGGRYTQFQLQFLTKLALLDDKLKKLFLFPTCGAAFYHWDGDWKQVYSMDLTEEEKAKIMDAFQLCFKEVGFAPEGHIYGELLEDRGTQITFSALGQRAPAELKKKFDPHYIKRLAMIEVLVKLLPEFEVRTGGSTSIDVTKQGISKAYGIEQIEKHLGFARNEMLFFGDGLFPGGNDYSVIKTGIRCIEVADPTDTANYLKELLGKNS